MKVWISNGFLSFLICFSSLCCAQLHADSDLNVEISGDLRSYFFQRDFKAGTTDKESFAIGGIVRGRFDPNPALKAGISLYTSQGAGLNDNDKNVYNLLATSASGKHENYTALGEAFIDIHNQSMSLKLGRQEMTTPWLNLHDVRMTPQSFDAVDLLWRYSEDKSLHLCHVARMKYKTDTKAESMSETAGFGGSEGVSCLGFESIGEIGLEFWGYRAHDLWDDRYIRISYAPKGAGIHADGRYLKRDSIGEQLAGNQDTWHAGISFAATLGAFDLVVAYSRNGQRDILRKWGHAITISNQVMVADRAKEQAWLSGAKYKPSSFPGLQLGISMALHNTPDSGIRQSPDRREYNFDLNYSLTRVLPGMSLRGRYARVTESGAGAEDLDDLRFYLRYLFKLN